MDIFDSKALKPMLIGEERAPFDSADWLFEIKFDGGRYLAYLDKRTVLISRRSLPVITKFPELHQLHKAVNARCILDGEIVTMRDGKPYFEAFQRRAVMSNSAAIEKAVQDDPVTFVVFDILYHEGNSLLELPLTERKKILERTVTENEFIVLSRAIEKDGVRFFDVAREQGLEGIIGKRKDSLYRPGTRTKEWVKIKNVLDDDYIICGYILNTGFNATIVLGQFNSAGELVYKGHATLSMSNPDYKIIASQPGRKKHPFSEPPPKSEDAAIWIRPKLVCMVAFLERTASGRLRHPMYRGLRSDKTADEVREQV